MLIPDDRLEERCFKTHRYSWLQLASKEGTLQGYQQLSIALGEWILL